MLASVRQSGLQWTVIPGFTWDGEQRLFRGQVLYGDEILTLCVTKDRMQRSLTSFFEIDADIEQLFDPAQWIEEAEQSHNPDVYFEEEDDLGPEAVVDDRLN